jgi:signal transduction histidine kinase
MSHARVVASPALVEPDGEGTVTTVFATLAHELRSPLQTMLLNVALCLERARGEAVPAWLVEQLEKQRRSAARLKQLIDTFLNVGQIAAGQLQLQTELVDLGELVGEVVARASDDLAWAGCPITTVIAAGMTGRWDRLQLDLVVTNLLSNAMKYGVGAPIEVTVAGTPELATVRVRDHGQGIARADQRRIFDKFTRLPAVSQVSGFGLGLWIVKHIVEASGGRIEVDSEPGRGATFVVSLPR